jgi:signal transduction histidine kinase
MRGDPTVSELTLLGHNLRTPLTIINGYADLLKNQDLTPQAREHACQQILEKCAELNALIRDFIDADEVMLSAGVRRTA